MRVAMITTPDLKSEWGSTLYAMLLANRLSAAGVDLHVYCRNHPVSASSLNFHDLPLPLSHPVLIEENISDSEMLSFARILAEAVVSDDTKAPFDVIHAHYATLTGLAALLTHIITGVPLVLSSFGRDISVGASRDERYRRMVALNLKGAHAVIASDSGLAREIVEGFAISPERVFMVEMPVDDNLFAGAKPQLDLRSRLLKDADYLVLNISSCFGEEKGIEVLLQAMAILKNEGLQLSLAVIGADDFSDRRRELQILDHARRLQVQELLTLTGRIPHSEIPSYMASADIVVDPRTVDNFSSSLLEAVFAGVVVLAPDTEGNRTRFDQLPASIFHSAGDAHDLATRMRSALTNKDCRKEVNKALLHWRKEQGFRYSADHVRDRVLEIYHSVARKSQPVGESNPKFLQAYTP